MTIFYILMGLLLSAFVLLLLSRKSRFRDSDIDFIIQNNFENMSDIKFPPIAKDKFYPKAMQISLSAFMSMISVISVTFLIDHMTHFKYMSEDAKFMSFGLVAGFHISMIIMATIFCIVPLFGVTLFYSYFIDAVLPQLREQDLIKKYTLSLFKKYFKYYMIIPIILYIVMKLSIGYGYFIIAPSLIVLTIVISIIVRLELIRVGMFRMINLMCDKIFPSRSVITDE